MVFRRVAAVLVLAMSLGWAAPAAAEIGQEDLILLGLVFRNRYGPYSEQKGADPRVTEIAESPAARRGGGASPLERYQALAEGVAIMNHGAWNEGIELSTIADMRLPAKLYEPGDRIEVRIEPVYEREAKLDAEYGVRLQLLDPDGEELAATIVNILGSVKARTAPLRIPEDAEPGRYSVSYELVKKAERSGRPPGPAILKGSRALFVLEGLGARLAELNDVLEALESKKSRVGGRSRELAMSTIQWHSNIYGRGIESDVPGAYTDHPIFMTSIMQEAGMSIERIKFSEELALAEELAQALNDGLDPLRTRTGDMRLAYVSPADGELVPFRVYVPSDFDPDKSYPLVIGLHGAGGDENSFMDRYQELFKANAERRGFIVASVNGRGPYGGYRGKSGQDVTDVLDLLQAIYPIDESRTYLTGHSMGGGGTVAIGFNEAERFAALAPIAGFGAVSQLEKAKDMPIVVGQGTEDALVPVERAREFVEAARKLGMTVEYLEREGVDHIAIVDQVMDEVFDFFEKHKKN